MKNMTRAAILVAALSGTLAACGSTGIQLGSDPTTTASTAAPATATTATTASTAANGAGASLPAGWKKLTGDTVSVGVPASWVDIKPALKDPTKRAAFEQAFKDQSTSAYLDSLAPEVVDKVDIFAVDGATLVSGKPSNLTTSVQKNSLIKDLDTLAAVVPGQLSSVGAKSTGTRRATIGGKDTLVIDYTVTTAKGEATGRQYDWFNRSDLIVTSFTSLSTPADTKLWDQIAATISVTG